MSSISDMTRAAFRLVRQAFYTGNTLNIDDNTNEKPNSSSNENDNGPNNPPYATTAQSIIQTALLLTRKLPGDLIPPILDYAELYIPLATASTSTRVGVTEHEAGIVVLECVIPTGMPVNVVRTLKITTTSQDQGWSSYPEDHGTYRGSWTWFEVAVSKARAAATDTSGGRLAEAKVSKSISVHGENDDDDDDDDGGVDGGDVSQQPRQQVRKRVVTNVHALKTRKTHEVIWTLSNDDLEIRDTIAQLRGGDVIHLSIWARYPGWKNVMHSASIEVEGVYVRRM